MARISVCIISYNEERNIEDCLKSVQHVADEIVVVDSHSTDKTREIASRYTDKIYEHPFLGHVEQYNLAVSKARNDWILVVDCDERLSPELEASILSIKDKLQESHVYRMARKTFYVYRWLNHCWYPDYTVRLFNRQTAEWGGTNPHAKVVFGRNNVNTLQGDILHYSFNSISEHIRTLDNFTEIGAKEIIERGKKVTLLSPWTHATWTFIKLYFIKRGFLDGFAGAVVSVLSFMHVFVKYSKAITYYRRNA
jgi:glycosyltransferase involved in cell wall biosynthesis